MWQVIGSLLLPTAFLVLAFFMAPLAATMPASQVSMLQALPMILAALLMLLTLRFNRSRLFFSTLLVAAFYITLVWLAPQQSAEKSRLIVQLLSLLAPLNLLIFSELKERGVFTGWGGLRFMVLLLPAVIGWLLIQYQPGWAGALLDTRFMAHDLTSWTTLSQPAQAVAVAVFFVMNGRLFSRPGTQRGALFGSLIGLLIMLHYSMNIYILSIFTTAVLLMFIAALIQDSWSMAYVDHLTGLPGRRALNEQLLKLSGIYSIAMLDIDHFKKFNDRYGHDVGDEALRMVAQRIAKVTAGGKAYRYGGEEFSIVFPGKYADDVLQALEEVRRQVESAGFRPLRKERRQSSVAQPAAGSKGVKITISIGVAQRSDAWPEPTEVIKAADQALYQAKQKGRNQLWLL